MVNSSTFHNNLAGIYLGPSHPVSPVVLDLDMSCNLFKAPTRSFGTEAVGVRIAPNTAMPLLISGPNAWATEQDQRPNNPQLNGWSLPQDWVPIRADAGQVFGYTRYNNEFVGDNSYTGSNSFSFVTNSILCYTSANASLATVNDEEVCSNTMLSTGIYFPLRIAAPTSISKAAGNLVQVVPNPFGSTFKITGLAGLTDIKVFSVTGQLVYERHSVESQDHVVDAASWPPGVYTLLCSGDVPRKIIKH